MAEVREEGRTRERKVGEIKAGDCTKSGARPACALTNFTWWHICYPPGDSRTRIRTSSTPFGAILAHFGASLCTNMKKGGRGGEGAKKRTFTS